VTHAAPTRPRWYLPTIVDRHGQKPERNSPPVTILRSEKHDDGAVWDWRSDGDIEVRAGGMLECKRTFTATYDGKQITLEAGRCRVSGDHELARSHPHHFRPARPLEEMARPASREKVRAGRTTVPAKPPKQSTAPRRWPAGYVPPKRPEHLTHDNCGVELLTKRRDRREPVTINLGRNAWREIRRAAELYAGTETTGGLYGPRTYGFQAVASVTTATDCGYDRQT
jgi:hypothetical protein